MKSSKHKASNSEVNLGHSSSKKEKKMRELKMKRDEVERCLTDFQQRHTEVSEQITAKKDQISKAPRKKPKDQICSDIKDFEQKLERVRQEQMLLESP